MFRRFFAVIGLIAALSTPSADALTGSRDLLLAGNQYAWVATGATTELDFANNRYYNCSLSTCLSLTRASSKTNLLPSSASGFAYSTFGSGVLAITPGFGLLIEESRVNQLFNSTAPATQTTGTLANGTYTLWVNGSGTATMSTGTATGCGTGVASQGTQINFTTTGTAGTCTVTVSGSLNAFQLELGPSGSSLIITAGATGTRAADVVAAAGVLNSTLQSTPGMSVMAKTQNITGVSGLARIIGTSTNSGQISFGSSTQVQTYNGSAVLSATIGTGSWAGTLKSAAAFTTGAGTRLVVGGAGTVASDSGGGVDAIHNYYIGSQAGSSTFQDGYISTLAVWNTNLSSAALKTVTVLP